MHYNDFTCFQDKMNHLFLAALGEGMYSQAIKEVILAYGDSAKNAVRVFESDYATLISRFN